MTERRLRELLPGWPLRALASVDSTNAEAKRWLEAGPPRTPALLAADEQTGGRGRFDRSWHTPRGGAVAMSIIVSGWSARADARPGAGLPQAAGVATAEAVEALASTGQVGLKWPNDVEIDGRKVAGILIEQQRAAGGAYFVVGIGINVDIDFAALGGNAAALAETATSIARYRRAAVDREALICEVAGRFVALRADVSLHERWKARLSTLGREISVLGAEGTVEGRAVDAEPDGRLVIETADGRRHLVSAGDVTIVRRGFPSGA